MQIRAPFALPSFKPLSRSASPASGTAHVGPDGALTPPLSPPKDGGRGRKSAELASVPSPLPSPGLSFIATEHGASAGEQKRARSLSRPLAKFSLSSSRAPTPAASPAPSPKLGGAAVLPPSAAVVKGGNAAPAPASADPSANMEAVGMRITEAVTRALAGSASAGEFKGRRGIARGTGADLARVVFDEFPAPPIDQYVLRAILRVSVKHLSVFASRLETVLLPAIIDPTFAHPVLFAPAPPSTIRSTVTPHGPASPFNPCQTYCLSLAHAAFEARHAFGEKLAGGPAVGAEAFPRFVGDALKPVIEKLDSIVGRVVLPLLATVKRELAAALTPLAEADKPAGAGSKPKLTGGHADPTPACLAVFASKVDVARRALAKIAGGCSEAGEGWVVGIAVATTWRGMVLLVERPTHFDRQSPRLGAKPLTMSTSASVAAGADAAPRPLLSAKTSASVATLLRPPPSRPSSPPRAHAPADGPTAAVLAFEQLVRRLVDGLVPYVLPAAPDPGHLAREALAEALEALQSLRIVVGALGQPAGLDTLLVGLRELKLAMDGPEEAAGPDASSEELLDALDDVPPVLLFHLFGNRLAALLAGRPPVVRPPHLLFGWTKDQYDAQVLPGFGAAEEWEAKVGAAVQAEVGRVLADVRPADERKWLEALSLAVDVI